MNTQKSLLTLLEELDALHKASIEARIEAQRAKVQREIDKRFPPKLAVR